jgi:hypothetical protein
MLKPAFADQSLEVLFVAGKARTTAKAKAETTATANAGVLSLRSE